MIRALLLLPILLLTAQPSMAIREGTATAEVFIKRYAQSGDYGRRALWHEAAAECLTRISVPMNEIAHAYYTRHGYEKWAARAKKEASEIQKLRLYHRARAETAWQQSETPKPLLDAEREKIAKFMAIWLPRYPNRFYEFGIYPTFFRKQRELAEQEGSYAKVLRLEADAAEMCAAQYQQIPIAHGLKRYEKFRDVYLRHAMHLRELAKQNPMTLSPEIDKGRRISNSLAIQTVSSQQIGYRLSGGRAEEEEWKDGYPVFQSSNLPIFQSSLWLTAESIAQQYALIADGYFQIAKSDARVKTTLAGQNGIHAYLSFQGFAWIVSFSNHSRGNLATAIVDAKTMKVLDVCISRPGRSGL